MHKVKIKVINDELDENCCDKTIWNKLNKIYDYEISDSTLIKELFNYLHFELETCDEDEESQAERFSFIVGDEHIFANTYFPLKIFLESHNILNEVIEIYYNIGIGGNGTYIDELAHIRINPLEPSHKFLPHVHVFKKNYNEAVRIEIETIKPLKGEEKIYLKRFTKKERKEIEEIIGLHKEELKDFYCRVQNGEQVKEFIIEHNNKEFIFK